MRWRRGRPRAWPWPTRCWLPGRRRPSSPAPARRGTKGRDEEAAVTGKWLTAEAVESGEEQRQRSRPACAMLLHHRSRPRPPPVAAAGEERSTARLPHSSAAESAPLMQRTRQQRVAQRGQVSTVVRSAGAVDGGCLLVRVRVCGCWEAVRWFGSVVVTKVRTSACGGWGVPNLAPRLTGPWAHQRRGRRTAAVGDASVLCAALCGAACVC